MNAKKELIDEITAREWDMFHAVNAGTGVTANCQRQPETFRVMRESQLAVWTPEMCRCYDDCLKKAADSGRNLAEEKYVRMMEFTDPAAFAALDKKLPPLSEKCAALVDEIAAQLVEQKRRLDLHYPAIAASGRPLEEGQGEDAMVAFETYLRGEFATYPQELLQSLLYLISETDDSGVNYSRRILENTVRAYGYKSLEDAEASLSVGCRV